MKVSLKLLLSLWVGLFLIIGVLLYNAYSKLKPETFIALLTEQVQKNYPGAKLNVGKVDYGFSLDFNLNLKDIHLRRSGKLLGSIGEVELRIPWWLLLFQRGNAQINISKLDIYIDHEDSPPVTTQTEATNAPNTVKVSLPDYLADAKFTVRAKEISIRDIHSVRRYFIVSKLLVREFQYGKNSAFEINVPVSITHGLLKYNSNLWLFGDLTPDPNKWELNYRGEFRTRENNDKLQLEDFVFIGSSTFSPRELDINATIKLSLDKEEAGTGLLKANQDGLLVDVKLNKFPLNYVSSVYDSFKNPYLKTLEGYAAGSIYFKKDFSNRTSQKTGKLSFDGNFQITETDIIPGKWQMSFDNYRWDISFISPKSEVSFFRRSVLDPKKNVVTQYSEELGFSNLNLSAVATTVKPISILSNEVAAAYYSSAIAFHKCVLQDQTFEGTFKYGVGPEQRFFQGDLKSAKSSMTVNFLSKESQKALDLKFMNFNWNPSFLFLDPFFTASEALLDGKIEGRWAQGWESGQWLFKGSATGPKDLKGRFPDFISKTTSFFGIEMFNFSKQTYDMFSKNGLITLTSLSLENPDLIKINGSLSTKQKSLLTLARPNDKKFKAMKKEIIEPYWLQKDEE